MEKGDYLQKRVDDQINWYDTKSQYYQVRYKVSQIIEIILAAVIPFLAGYVEKVSWFAIIIALFGVLITIIESVNKLYKFHENWLQYRSTCEMLRYEKYLFITQSAPYNEADETKYNLFVRKIEQIVSSENNQWKLLNTKQSKTSEN